MTGVFDLQAHRGGIGLTVENTLAAFRTAIALGVSTLECDVNISADDVPMVTHDKVVLPSKCRGAHVGRLVRTLTCEQLKTLDCGSQTSVDYPRQRAVPGERMPTLAEVLALVREVPGLRVNVEVKTDVVQPDDVAPREVFVEMILATVHDAGLVERVSVQSFDWAALRLVGAASPRTALYALTAPSYLQAGVAGASPWLGGLDIDDVGGDVVAAVAAQGFTAISPAHGVPFLEGTSHPSYVAFVTPEMVASAHEHGLLVVPWTIDDVALLETMLDLGVDGVITNYPDRALAVLARRGIATSAPTLGPGPGA